MEVHPAEYSNLPLYVESEHGKAEDQRADDEKQPESLEWSPNRALDWCKQHYSYFKTSALGILIIQRWLPIQDYGSDSLVTFCPDSLGSFSVLCSDKGLWWTKDWWWGHLSASFIILPYVVLWMSSAPILMHLAASEHYHAWLSAVISLTWTYWCVSALIVILFDWNTLACTLGLLIGWTSALIFGLIATRLFGPNRVQHFHPCLFIALVLLGGAALYFIGPFNETFDWSGKMFAVIFAGPPCVPIAILLWYILVADLRRGIFITWICFGLPVVFLLDFIMILAFPLKHPTYGWLRNIGRLRCVLESLIESPTQCPLQVRIAIYRFLHRGACFPWTLLFSIGTSLLSVALTWIDLRADAQALNISTIEVVWDLLIVGLQRRAPLLHLLRVSEEVDYALEGRLKSNHITEILSVCRACGGLRELRFGKDSGLGLEHLKDIVLLTAQLSIVDAPGFLTSSSGTLTIMAAVSVEHLDILLPMTEQLDVVVEDLTIPATHGFGPEGCAKLKPLKLRKLVIDADNNIGIDGCGHLSTLADLHAVHIGSDNGIGHEGCEKLMQLNRLVSLQIGDGNRIGHAGCDHLSKLVDLKTLQIGSDNGIGHEGCERLMQLKKLVSLQIGDGNRIGHAGCDHLSKLVDLKTLQIGSDNGIGHEGCTKLIELSKLECLKIGPENGITKKEKEDVESKKSSTLTDLDISVT